MTRIREYDEKSFEVAYQKLQESEQAVLQVFAVIHKLISISDLLRVVKKLKILSPKGKPFSSATLKDLVIDLQNKHFTFSVKSKFTVFQEYSESLMRRYTGDLQRTYDSIYETFNYLNEFDKARFRIFFYGKDTKNVEKEFTNYEVGSLDLPPFSQVCLYPFDPKFLDTYDKRLKALTLFHSLKDLLAKGEFHAELFQYTLKEIEIANKKEKNLLNFIIAEIYLYQGELTKAQKIIDAHSEPEFSLLHSILLFQQGNLQETKTQFEKYIPLVNQKDKKDFVQTFLDAGIFYTLALLQGNTPEGLQQAMGYIDGIISSHKYLQPLHPAHNSYAILQITIRAQKGNKEELSRFARVSEFPEIRFPLQELMLILALHWFDKNVSGERKKHLEKLYSRFQENGYAWMAAEIAEIFLQAKSKNKKYSQSQKQYFHKVSKPPLLTWIKPLEEWQMSLNALSSIVKKTVQNSKATDATTPNSLRMTWWLSVNLKDNSVEIFPKEQKYGKKGWSSGRPVSLKKLFYDRENYPYLTEQDKKVLTCIREYEEETYNRYYTNTYYEINTSLAILYLLEHPLVFNVRNDSPVELEQGELELSLTTVGTATLHISLLQNFVRKEGIQILEDSPTRFKFYNLSEKHLKIIDIVREGVSFPLHAKDQVLHTIQSLSSLVVIHSEIGGNSTSNAKEIVSDSTPHILLSRFHQGLRISIMVAPFGESGAYVSPGTGGAHVFSNEGREQVVAKRNLIEETEKLNSILYACPIFAAQETKNHNEWVIEDRTTCLEVLLEFDAIKENVVLEWPDGQELKIKESLHTSHLHLGIRKQEDWFELSGEIHIDDSLLLDMQNLLDLLETSEGRFVRMKDGEFLALTNSFYEYLQDLETFTEKNHNGRRFHPFAGMALEELSEKAGSYQADKEWKQQLKKIKSLDKFKPKFPKTFQGELRDYQMQGYNWLQRLHHWGVGACLADDMGLGKTIQALVLILQHANKGPALVVAPTSVCMNWQKEAWRFAPSLNVIELRDGDRQETLANLKAFDLLLCSYGLLQQEKTAELLAEKRFEVIVLDEAQAIKNFSSKRAKAAYQLKGNFKIVTTGTPIENHLGELWSLFNFINPGLFGSLKQFNEKYAVPIERNREEDTRKRLKKLIQPFILRRLKTEVLEELPPKTEILLEVELGKEERAFYEALRLKTINKLSKKDSKPGQKHIEILAEIMKLRRACCHPKLVAPKLKLSSSKLAAFDEILHELLQNKHKALVFSQFVDHLKIVRTHLDKEKISYQYLDGSTPAKERQKRVDAFQAGEGDVFLISLKAGGSGLNLTVADYVIHLDPWWNPAVEDQASDRAHRIGQTRPVTIYRLVSKDTIEEKIVGLHSRKRDLADSLLEGSNMSGKISAQELLELIKEG
ncbi:MAG: DEAD/DEAH box helicase [Spirochaetota bacterium]